MRKFELVKKEFRKYDVNELIKMPVRATFTSVAYDVFSPIEEIIKPGETKLIFSNVKAYFNDDEVLYLATTSGMGKKQLMLSQGVAVIENDYVDNTNNDGNLGFMLFNHGTEDYVINKGDKLGHAWFGKFLITDNDVTPTRKRAGGFGSTLK